MFYKSEFNYLNKKYSIKNRIVTGNVSASKGIFRFLQNVSARSSIHGVQNLFDDNLRGFERILWWLIIFGAIFGMSYVCLILSQKFSDQTLQTVVESTALPVFQIPFPTITICNQNRLNWSRIKMAQQRFLPSNTTENEIRIFTEFLKRFDNAYFGHLNEFGRLRNESLELIDHISLTEIVEFMSWTCEEMFEEGSCFWRGFSYPCCEILLRQHSELGICFAFNAIISKDGRAKEKSDPLWPWRTPNGGLKTALEARILLKSENHVPESRQPKGIRVMVHEPPIWQSPSPIFIAENTESVVEIEPIVYYFDNETHVISSNVRKCVFEDENTSSNFKTLPGLVYMLSNCLSQCHQEYLLKYCNCSLDVLFLTGNYPLCKPSDFHCLYKYNKLFSYTKQQDEDKYVTNYGEGMECPCFRNCYSLNYYCSARSNHLPLLVTGNISFIDLDVHFGSKTLLVYRTNLVFGWVDLLVSFGGIAGLFLGCSMISGVEIIYFIIIDLPLFLCQKYEGKLKTNRKLIEHNGNGVKKPDNNLIFLKKKSPKIAYGLHM